MTSAQKKVKPGQGGKNRRDSAVPVEDVAPRGAVPVPRPNQKGKAKQQEAPAPEAAKVVPNEKLLPAIERVKEQRGGNLTGTELKRILWWNDQGQLTTDLSKSLDERIVDAIGKELTAVENATTPLPPFMRVRNEFGVKLPASLGGAMLTFKTRAMFAIFQGESAWISENVLWLPKPDGGPKVRLMIHVILNWQLMAPPESEPDPHITVRLAETQAKIDLDTIEPIMKGKAPGEGPDVPRIKATKEATSTSFSRGLGQPRAVGAALPLPEDAKKTLESAAMKDWLEAVARAAQQALIQQPVAPTKV